MGIGVKPENNTETEPPVVIPPTTALALETIKMALETLKQRIDGLSCRVRAVEEILEIITIDLQKERE